MPLSRRGFMWTLGVGGGGAISAALISGRGHEELMGLGGASDAPVHAAGDEEIRLSSNENPRGPAPAALDAVRGALGVSNRYPGGFGSRALAEGLAKFHDLSPDNLVLGAGSGEVLRMAVAAFTSPTRPLVDAQPTFEAPGGYARIIGTPVRSVPVDDRLRLDLEGMAEQAGEAGLVFVCNPNNPTATVHSAEAIRELVDRVNRASPETMLLIDEAYHEFVDDPSYATALSLAVENSRVIVSRTFSKVYGMAGLRVGYGVGHPETIRRMRPHKLGSSVNVLGAAAALTSLGLDSHVRREAELNREARDYTRKVFTELGFTVGPSQTNFVMAHIQSDVREFQRACREQGILVGRPFPPLTDYARVSIGTLDEMRRAAEVFRKVLGAPTSSS